MIRKTKINNKKISTKFYIKIKYQWVKLKKINKESKTKDNAIKRIRTKFNIKIKYKKIKLKNKINLNNSRTITL